MPKFTFTCNHSCDGPTISYVTNQETLHDVLSDITDFLRGAGYVIDGTLDVVHDDCSVIEDTAFDINLHTMNSSSFYNDDIVSITGACVDTITLDDGTTLTIPPSNLELDLDECKHSDYYYDINRNR